MVVHTDTSLEWQLRCKRYDSIRVKGESKSLIKFLIDPKSFHQKTWIKEGTEEEEEEATATILCMSDEEPIRRSRGSSSEGKFIQIETEMLPTVSPSILLDLLSDVPQIPAEVHAPLANAILYHLRDGIQKENQNSDKQYSRVIFINLTIDSVIVLERNCEDGVINTSCKVLERCAACPEETTAPSSSTRMQIVMQLPCLHNFHTGCIMERLREEKDRCCPVCQFKVPLPSLALRDLYAQSVCEDTFHWESHLPPES